MLQTQQLLREQERERRSEREKERERERGTNNLFVCKERIPSQRWHEINTRAHTGR